MSEHEPDNEREAWLTLVLKHLCHLLIILVFFAPGGVFDNFISPIEKHLNEVRDEWIRSPIITR